MNRFFSVSLFFLTGTLPVLAQDTVFARKTLEILCSKKFAGRGYVRHGQERAADWILKEFEKEKPAQCGIQEFNDQVIVFKKNPSLIIDGKKMNLGSEWLPDADALPLSGNFKVQILDSTSFAHSTQVAGNSIFLAPTSIRTKAQNFAQKNQRPLLIYGNQPPLWTVKRSFSRSSALYWKGNFSEPPKKVKVSIYSEIKNHTFQNVWAVLPGKSDSIILISAHYDHLGQCGPVMFPGANDNASGTAMMLDLFHHLSKENRPYTYVFCAFSGEEAGLLGSTYFVKNPSVSLEKLKFVVNLDLMATGEEGITVVNAIQEKEIYQRMLEINKEVGLPQIAARSNAPNSDHYPFTQAGYRAIFLYAQGPSVKAYHHPDDVPEKVLWKGYHQIFHLIHTLIQ
jgi:hypothetical protein